MIPERYITEWSEQTPWVVNKFIEQDLIVCRALVSIYSDAFLAGYLAFRGDTALGKLCLKPQPRHSEDINLLQVQAETIKETIDYLRDALAWLDKPVVKQKKHNSRLVFKVQPTDMDAGEIHLKVEINCKKHFCVFPMVRYELAELTGTKLWAVYQRRKGCDLFDLWKILLMHPELDKGIVMESYKWYLGFTASHLPTYKEFVLNMDGKLQDEKLLPDTEIILGAQVEYAPSGGVGKGKSRVGGEA